MHKKLMAVMLFVLSALGALVMQQVARTAPALTALDYAEIHQLYARYAFAADMPTDDGDMYARTFTEDGVFDVTNPFPTGRVFPVEGREELKALAVSLDSHTPLHYTTNILIETTPEGTMGTAYLIAVSDAED